MITRLSSMLRSTTYSLFVGFNDARIQKKTRERFLVCKHGLSVTNCVDVHTWEGFMAQTIRATVRTSSDSEA